MIVISCVCCFLATVSASGTSPDSPDMALWGPCPVATHRNYQRMICTVSLGESRILQHPDSNVSLSIPQGSPGVYAMRVHTDVTNFLHLIATDECIVAPVVEVVSAKDTVPADAAREEVYTLKVPQCRSGILSEQTLKVQHIGSQHTSFQPAAPSQSSNHVPGTFKVDENYITIYTTKFSKFVCTSGEHTCDAEILISVFGKLNPTLQEKPNVTTVNMKAFLLSELYKIKDIMQVSGEMPTQFITMQINSKDVISHKCHLQIKRKTNTKHFSAQASTNQEIGLFFGVCNFLTHHARPCAWPFFQELKEKEEGFGYSFLDEKPLTILKEKVDPQETYVTMKLYPEGTWGPSHDQYAEEEDWDWDGKAFMMVSTK